jgi:dehydrogenase/reductase SDR family protein 7
MSTEETERVSEGTKAEFREKIVWITGASSGIGEGLAKSFSSIGARVVLSGRNLIELNRVKDESINAGANESDLLVLPLDVVDFDSIPPATSRVLDEFSRIDLLINNAGQGARDFITEMDFSIYRKIMDVNLFSAIALTKAVLPHMIERGSGRIVGVSSLAGKVGVPLRTAYCPAKHAVLGFFDSLRAEVAHYGIKVSTILPGVVRTNTVANALKGNGEPIGASEGVMEGGLSVTEAVLVMVEQLASGKDEIEVMTDAESQMLTAKKSDPTALFRMLEGMAEKELFSDR